MFAFNRIMMVRVIAALAMIAIFVTVARRATLVPGRAQNVVEIILDFARVQIAEEILGKERGRRYAPMITTILVSIFFFNVTGVIPVLNIASTSLIGLPLLLAAWVMVMYLGAGIKHQGLGGFLKNSLFPPGAPWYMYFLLTPIEFLQVFLLRPGTLALRLTANMIAGHIMLALAFAATQFFLFEAGGALKVFSVASFAGGVMFMLFEALVAALQAYIFALLAAVYLNLALEAEH
ncbi:F0F1 ATP synthase subunit A [Actinotalea lenta]|uniref:F0F1 ATP synthase subunit A n=1 Tax=Actinotalea lenta TaxID=3064654 RepID=UPI0033130348